MKLRKLYAGLAAAAFAATMAFSVSAADAVGQDGEAGIAFASGDWTAQYWLNGEEFATKANNTIVTGDGTYTVSVEAAAVYEDEETGEEVTAEGATDIAFAALQIVNGETLFPGMIITIDSVKFDGVEAALSGTPYTSSDEGITTRVNLYNEWVNSLPDDARTVGGLASDATPTALNKAVGEWKVMEVTFTVSGTAIEGRGDDPSEIDPAAVADVDSATETTETATTATAGDTTAATNSSKGSPNTGIADVAAIAGIAVVAAGAVIVAKKRK